MRVEDAPLPGVRILTPVKHGDARGFFSETYSKPRYAALGIAEDFMQDNHSLSADKGVVRGLHFQANPMAQAKLLRVVRGAVFDVMVDLRHGSPTYGRHFAVTISADAWNQVYVPAGLAHGFCTLEPGTEVIYKASAPYSPAHEAGLLWNDPDLGIDWPVSAADAILSPKDTQYPRLRDLRPYFTFRS